MSGLSGLDLKERAERRGVTELIEQGCLVAGVSVSEFYSRSKLPRVSTARAIIWIALRRRGFSLTEIAWLGGNHHSTVYKALKGADLSLEVRA